MKTYIKQCNIRMIVTTNQQCQISGTIQQFQGCTDLTVGKTVQCQMGLEMGT